ncbi:MAG: geranylgeranylglyceryl/heptaprenylglyceryl phosphate synthase [Flavobacteriales bacterium]|nr:geranylgeranylglyceryl/heptaprenylglyceryl phosphate synthase [Flavobacteriales bacterium]
MPKKQGILNDLLKKAREEGNKLLAILIDPDKFSERDVSSIARFAKEGADIFLVGGSLMISNELESTVQVIKEITEKPVYIFPSSPAHISPSADGLLFLSLLSSRNAELLIGKHVEAAPLLSASGIHVMSTGYLLIDCGNTTTAHYMSQSLPIPYEKSEIAMATSLAGEYLGMQCIYLDGGSGAKRPISKEMIQSVKSKISLPIIVGGGIRNAESARIACEAGADMVVIGTALENEPELFQDINIAVHSIRVPS